MKIKHFEATEVYERFNFNIDFNDDINFISSPNGGGKTTVLELIYSLLAPSISDLIRINYKSAKITFTNISSDCTIEAIKTGHGLELHFKDLRAKNSDDIKPLKISNEDIAILDYDNDSYQMKKFYNSPIVKEIRKIPSPLYLNLERVHKSINYEPRAYSRSIRRTQPSQWEIAARHRVITTYHETSLSKALKEVQQIIRLFLIRRSVKEAENSKLTRKEMFLSIFNYEDNFMKIIEEYNQQNFENIGPILKDQDAILSTFKDSFGLSELETQKIKIMLKNLGDLLKKKGNKTKKNKEDSTGLLSFINFYNFKYIRDLGPIIKKYNKKIQAIDSALETFKEKMNFFFEESGKEVEIDNIEELKVFYKHSKDKKYINLENLSSGEKHLLIIFANLLFSNESEYSNIYIIDEPELSLHIRWQENFVEKAMEIDKDVQFILATHSPDIINRFGDCVLPLVKNGDK